MELSNQEVLDKLLQVQALLFEVYAWSDVEVDGSARNVNVRSFVTLADVNIYEAIENLGV